MQAKDSRKNEVLVRRNTAFKNDFFLLIQIDNEKQKTDCKKTIGLSLMFIKKQNGLL